MSVSQVYFSGMFINKLPKLIYYYYIFISIELSDIVDVQNKQYENKNSVKLKSPYAYDPSISLYRYALKNLI